MIVRARVRVVEIDLEIEVPDEPARQAAERLIRGLELWNRGEGSFNFPLKFLERAADGTLGSDVNQGETR